MSLPHPLSMFEAVVEGMSDRAVRCRSLGGLFVCGGALAAASLALAHPAPVNDIAIVILGMVACLAGLVMVTGARWVPAVALSPLLALGTLLTSGAVYFSHSSDSVYALFYVWVGFYAAYFLTRHEATGHVASVGVSYALVLWTVSGGTRAERWLLLMGTLAVIGGLIAAMRVRVARLIGRLSDATRTDPLTGLLNRRGFEALMEIELERAMRGGQPLGLILADLDHFKLVNNRLGHAAGDRTLQRFAAAAIEVSRRIDGVARMGGEEFAVLLPGTDQQGAYVVAERLRRGFRTDSDEHGWPSVSLGISSFPSVAADRQALMRTADQALYAAKALGRDRSVIFNHEVLAGILGGETPRLGPHEHLSGVLLLVETLDFRDGTTADHSQSVGELSALIATRLGLPAARVERIRLAGILHDIGNIGVSDSIMNKAAGLTEEEWTEVRRHPEMGARIIAAANLPDISAWVMCHHERLDGHGYPRGVPASEIVVEARILAVAEAFQAMTSDHAYRAALTAEQAGNELRRQAGTQFDGSVVEALLSALARAAAAPGV